MNTELDVDKIVDFCVLPDGITVWSECEECGRVAPVNHEQLPEGSLVLCDNCWDDVFA